MDSRYTQTIKTKKLIMMEQKEEKKIYAEQGRGKVVAGKLILLGLGLVGLGVGGYFAYRHFTKDESLETSFNPDIPTENENFEVPTTNSNSGGSSRTSNGFPLKRGSRGKYVGILQKALARKFGRSVLGHGGIDKIFGKDTERALTSNGLPKVFTSKMLEDFIKPSKTRGKGGVIIQSTESGITVSKPKDLAWNLRTDILKGRFDLVVEKLEKIRTVKDYDLVNEFFKEWLVFGVRKTIVTALLQKFKSESDTKKLAVHFKRIGLVKKSDGKWYKKEGLGNAPKHPKIKAIRTAKIWNTKGESLKVPANTILGEYLHAENGVTEFATIDDKILLINTKNISYV